MTPSIATAQDFWLNTNSSNYLTVVMEDFSGNPVPNLPLPVDTYHSEVESGGHRHPMNLGGVLFVPARLTAPRPCYTGHDGNQCRITISVGPAGSTLQLWIQIMSGPYWGFYRIKTLSASAFGGFPLGTRLEDYQNDNFSLIGQTSTHPDNHYCEWWICNGAVDLANSYRDRWDLRLAYNDVSLTKGGVFDIRNDFRPPHREHQNGRSIDVRANGGENSIPFDDEIRAWFVMRVREIFGQPPAHEDERDPNEHYHIRG